MLAAVCGGLLFARAASAQPLGDAVDSIEVHGFVSQGFILTMHNDYLAEGTTDGSFEFSELGLNFTKQLSDSLRTGVQFFAHDLGPIGNYEVKADWFYMDYRFQDWLGLRAGRLKIPYGLHNEVQDVDAARVPVLLPQSVYPLQTREILFSQTGGELYGFGRLGALGALSYRLFGGTIFLDADELTPAGAAFELEFQVPYVLGARLLWETPLPGLTLGASVQKVRLDTSVVVPSAVPLFVIESRSLLWVTSLEYAVAGLMLTAEYSRWHAEQTSTNLELSPPIEETSERAYVMGSYSVTSWFTPGLYYSLLFPNVSNRSGKENVQHDVAATLRFDLTPHWLLKLEGHYMSGTAGLFNPLRINPPDLSRARENWTAYFLKTTVSF